MAPSPRNNSIIFKNNDVIPKKVQTRYSYNDDGVIPEKKAKLQRRASAQSMMTESPRGAAPLPLWATPSSLLSLLQTCITNTSVAISFHTVTTSIQRREAQQKSVINNIIS